jgi:exodeoxyribonuclease (lambda-induced)
MEQKSYEWYVTRMGKITGSQFEKAMGSIRVKNTFIKKLIKERELLAKGGEALAFHVEQKMAVSAPALDWGNNHEDQAVAAFELEYDMDVDKEGFATHPDYEFIGVSVDGTVRDNDSTPHAVVEAKCPYNPKNHQDTLMLGMPEKHYPQVQGNTWVKGLGMAYFISFDPRAEPENRLFVEPVDLDHEYISRLEAACVEINACVEKGELLEPPKAAALF